jgi:hypothetical protein
MTFNKSKTSSLVGTYAWVYSFEGVRDFRVTANANGILIEGESPQLNRQEHLEIFAKVITDAWKEFIKLTGGQRTNEGLPEH